MSLEQRNIAKLITLIELIVLFLLILSYFWLKNVLVGAFLILFFIGIMSCLIGLIYSYIFLHRSKKERDIISS